MISRISSKETEVNLAFCVIQKFLQQTSKFPLSIQMCNVNGITSENINCPKVWGKVCFCPARSLLSCSNKASQLLFGFWCYYKSGHGRVEKACPWSIIKASILPERSSSLCLNTWIRWKRNSWSGSTKATTVSKWVTPHPWKAPRFWRLTAFRVGVWHKEMTATLHSAKLGE